MYTFVLQQNRNKMPKQQYNIRIEPSLVKEIQQRAKEDDRSVNWSIEEAIRRYCRDKG